MEDLTDIKRIWTNMPDERVPDFRQISGAVKEYRTLSLIKTAALVVLMLGLAMTMVWVIIDYESQLVSTRIGEGLMIFAIIVMLSYTIRTMRRLSATNVSNSDFLSFLKDEQSNLFQFQKKTQVIGFAAASIGLLLYLYEGFRMNSTELMVAYTFSLAWIGIAWFVVRPRIMRRKITGLEERIREVERIARQIKGY